MLQKIKKNNLFITLVFLPFKCVNLVKRVTADTYCSKSLRFGRCGVNVSPCSHETLEVHRTQLKGGWLSLKMSVDSVVVSLLPFMWVTWV